MNLSIPQYKNCWKWSHTMFSYRIQGSKCVKCNGSHKSKNHCDFGWCCKANNKINPLRLETKKGKPCSHSFKCLNCFRDHQADSNLYPFWRIGSTGSGNRKSILRSVKTDPSQFVLKQMTHYNNDCEEPQNSFTKCSQKLFNCQYSP